MSKPTRAKPKILHLDIETGYNMARVWGCHQQYVSPENIASTGRTICWAAKWDGEKEIMFSSEWGDGFEAMIHWMWELLAKADWVVHYNGTKFDIPTLNREFLLLDLAPPTPSHEIDLLRTCRQRFRFVSNKLDFVSQQLGLGCKTHHKGMALWDGVLAGVKKDQRKMEEYNKQDVVLLEALYHRLLPWIKNHPSWAPYIEGDYPVCKNCGSTDLGPRGTYYTKAGIGKQRLACKSCGKSLVSSTVKGGPRTSDI